MLQKNLTFSTRVSDFPAPIRMSFHVEQRVLNLWSCIIEKHRIAAWWGEHVALDVRKEGKFRQQWRSSQGEMSTIIGQVTRIEPPKILQFSWKSNMWNNPSWQTFVTFAFSPETEMRSQIILLHTGWESLPEHPGRELRYRCETRWREHTTNLRYHAEYTNFSTI